MNKAHLEIPKVVGDASFFTGNHTIQEVRKRIGKVFLLYGHRRSYKKRGSVFDFNDNANEAYLVENGRIRTYKTTPEGKQVTFEIINTGDCLGLTELLVNSRRIRSAEAMSNNTTLLVMRKEQILDLMSSDREFWSAMTWAESYHIMRYQRMVEDLATLRVYSRVTQLLVKMAEERGRQVGECIVIDYPLTHGEIACMVGSARQTITLILNELREKRIIDWKQKTISIISFKDLCDQALEFC